MVWSRNNKFRFALKLLLICFSATNVLAQDDIEEIEVAPPEQIEEYYPEDESQMEEPIEATEEYDEELEFIEPEPEQLNEKKIWTDEAWQESIKEIRYEKEPEKEEKQEPLEEEEAQVEYEEPFDWSDWLQGVFLSDLAKIICIILVVALLTFLIIQLTRARIKSAKIKLQPVSAEIPTNLDEDLPESDLERYLRLALEKSDFKTAVRVLFLMSIQKMNELELIRWKKDKTNRDYLNEIRPLPYYGDFRELTLIYEVVWYGERNLIKTEFDQVKGAFDQYRQKLGTGHEA